MSFYRDDSILQSIDLPPANPIAVPGSPIPRALATTYNRVGGLMGALAAKAGIPIEAALAVWQAESGGEAHVPGRPVLRFENHKFFTHWGRNNEAAFDRHFRFGGRGGVPGEKWKNHTWRRSAAGAWQRFHGDQDKEYEVFAFAGELANPEAACLASSFGGPQILGSNHRIVGYESAKALFDAMVDSERWEVCAFFDFCQSNSIIDELKRSEWLRFATVYNGPGQAPVYGTKIDDYHEVAVDLPIPAAGAAIRSVPGPAATAPGGAEFAAKVAGWNLRNIKAYELLTMGHQHADRQSPAHGLNTPPPPETWDHIEETARVLDELRQVLGAPVIISSAYRSPAYNAAIGGARHSQHVDFNALDFSVRSHTSPADWASALKQMRANGRFKGGIGVYSTFVHVDTRGTNADW